jgi:hypothetical protein
MPSFKTCDQVVPDQVLLVLPHTFQCPFCGANWERGGHKEGFVKASAFRHVAGCRAVVLLDKGYLADLWTSQGQIAVPVADAHPKLVKAVKLIKRARTKAGLVPTVSNQGTPV